MKRYICFWLLATTCCLTGFAQNDNDYSVSQNPQKNQAVLTLKDGSKKYYDTGSVTSMDFSGANITVNQQAGSYTFQDNVKAVAFNKGNALGIVRSQAVA